MEKVMQFWEWQIEGSRLVRLLKSVYTIAVM